MEPACRSSSTSVDKCIETVENEIEALDNHLCLKQQELSETDKAKLLHYRTLLRQHKAEIRGGCRAALFPPSQELRHRHRSTMQRPPLPSCSSNKDPKKFTCHHQNFKDVEPEQQRKQPSVRPPLPTSLYDDEDWVLVDQTHRMEMDVPRPTSRKQNRTWSALAWKR